MLSLNYQKPATKKISGFMSLALTQYEIPSNPQYDCFNANCQNNGQTPDQLQNVVISWQDNSGSDVNGYSVQIAVSPDGNTYPLQNGSPAGCSISENPVDSSISTYILNCSSIELTGGAQACGCNDTASFIVLEILDPDGNTIAPNDGCSNINSGGPGCA